jgi:hypothetical protein
MLEQLERIVLADEECVSRIDFAAKRAERETSEARGTHDLAVSESEKAFTESFEREIAQIRAEGEKRIVEKRAALDEYLRRLTASAEVRLEVAAQRYARIVAGEADES